MPVVSRSGTTTTFAAENKLASLSGKILLPPNVETAGNPSRQSTSQHFSPSTQKTYSCPSAKALTASMYL